MDRRDLVEGTARSLPANAEVDGEQVYGALLLVADTATAAASVSGADAASWDFCSIAVRSAIEQLGWVLADTMTLVGGLPEVDAADVELRTAVHGLVCQIAGRYHAAGAGGAPPGRRLIWDKVAGLLDDAAAELV
jgi:hypothetical protein